MTSPSNYGVDRARLVLPRPQVEYGNNTIRTKRWQHMGLRIVMTLAPRMSLWFTALHEETAQTVDFDLSFALGYAFHDDFPVYVSETLRYCFEHGHDYGEFLRKVEEFETRGRRND